MEGLMTTASPAASPLQVGSRLAVALALLAGVIRNSLTESPASPFYVLTWTAAAVLAFYAAAWALTTLTGRPLSSRADLCLQGMAVLIVLGVAGWGAVAMARSGRWELAGLSAAVAAVNGVMLWLVVRHLRAWRTTSPRA
jgi:hypothetical protein